MINTGQSPPGEFGHPILGNLKALRTRVLDFFCSLQNKYGDVSTIRFSIRNVSYIQHPDIIQHVLQENNRNYTKSLRYEQLRYLLGNGLLTSEGEFWLRQRRMIQPGFHKNKIELLFTQMKLCAKEIVENMNERTINGSINISDEMMALTLQIVGKTLLSTDMKSDAKNMSVSLSYLLKAVNIRTRTPILLPLWVPLPEHIKIKREVKNINKILDKVFSDRRHNPNSFNDLLTMLMAATYEDNGEHMNNSQLRDEVMTLFVAGHETTANALSWTLYLLSTHPEELNKCKSEIKNVIGNSEFTFNHLQNLQYLTMVIEESMRLYPPAWVIGRKTILPDTLGKYKVPGNHNVLISPYALHRDKRYWPDPEKFIPERFNQSEIKKRPKFAYIPFGGGPRLCIGNNFAMMEMQVVLALLIQKYNFTLADSYKIETNALITLRAKNGIKLNLTKAA